MVYVASHQYLGFNERKKKLSVIDVDVREQTAAELCVEAVKLSTNTEGAGRGGALRESGLYSTGLAWAFTAKTTTTTTSMS